MQKTIYICDVCKKEDETTTLCTIEIKSPFKKDIKYTAELCSICYAMIANDIQKALKKYNISPKEERH